MKSFPKIQKSGMKMHNGISDVITAEILLTKGHRYSQHNEYELWCCPCGKQEIWYITKNSNKRSIIIDNFKPRDIKSPLNENADKFFLQLSKMIEEKEHRIAKLQQEILELKTKKKVKGIEQEYSLEMFIPQITSN